jgi:nitroreductase
MDFRDLVMDRYSVRKYDTEREIPEEAMQLILDAAVQAPTAHNYQPFTIYRLRSDEMRAKAQTWYPRPTFATAREVLLIVGDEEAAYVYPDGQNNTIYTDTAIAISYMQLQATDLGIGSVWINAFDRPLCAQDMGLEMGKRTPVALLALGYAPDGDKRPKRKRKAFDEVIETI